MIDPNRLVVGTSPYFGERGGWPNGYNSIMLQRSLQAPATYVLPPFRTRAFED